MGRAWCSTRYRREEWQEGKAPLALPVRWHPRRRKGGEGLHPGRAEAGLGLACGRCPWLGLPAAAPPSSSQAPRCPQPGAYAFLPLPLPPRDAQESRGLLSLPRPQPHCTFPCYYDFIEFIFFIIKVILKKQYKHIKGNMGKGETKGKKNLIISST